VKQFISILLSLLLLASSSGVVYAQHYCGDAKMMTQVTLGEADLFCDMTIEEEPCFEEYGEVEGCCDNDYTQVIIDDNFAKAHYKISFNSPFVAAYIATFFLDIQHFKNTDVVTNTTYNPPPLIKNLPVLYKSFLI